jgi:hypothetical protein
MLSLAVGGLAFSGTIKGARLVFWTMGVLDVFAAGFAAGGAAFGDAAGVFVAITAAAGFVFVFGFLVLALAFLAALFFFLSTAAFDLSSRNSDLSCLICFFSAFLRVSSSYWPCRSPAGGVASGS